MKTLYNEIIFNQAKSGELLPLICSQCSKKFYLSKHCIQTIIYGIKKRKRKNIVFCSIKCRRDYIYPPFMVVCKQCLKLFRKKPKEIRKSKNNFCCQSCAATYNNLHKVKGTRISKLEKWISFKLKETYPNLEIFFNKKDAINSELDIYIPSLRLAFELNGIFHYEPIYSHDKFIKIQNNDKQKINLCFKKGIELIIIDVSRQKTFTEKSSYQYLEIINGLILLNIKRLNGGE